MTGLPVINVSPLRDPAADHTAVAAAIGAACRDSGFFYVSGHGVPSVLLNELDALSREFFALPDQVKEQIAMTRAGGRGAVGSRSAASSPRAGRI